MFLLPVDQCVCVRALRVERCRWLSSKKVPLWLVFANADPDGEDVSIIFKVGDDLRQDMLTLQLMHLMDAIWSQAGLRLRMNLYGVTATGWEQGVIQPVAGAESMSKIQGSIASALKEDVLTHWLRALVPSAQAGGGWAGVVERFGRSCAAYCCATFVLGIGDRHNDNIMCTETGELFHIDFG